MRQEYNLRNPYTRPAASAESDVVIDGPREGYYEHVFRCGNCGKKATRYIRKGEKVDSVSFECPNCGCTISEKGVWR